MSGAQRGTTSNLRHSVPPLAPLWKRWEGKREKEEHALRCVWICAVIVRVLILGLDLLHQKVLTRDGVEYRIPYIARKAIEYLETNALEVKGLFRMSGDNDAIQDLRTAVEEGENIDLFKVFDSFLWFLLSFLPFGWTYACPSQVKDPHNVSCLLKLYIRELPEPLGTFARYDEWLRVSTLPSEDEQIEV